MHDGQASNVLQDTETSYLKSSECPLVKMQIYVAVLYHLRKINILDVVPTVSRSMSCRGCVNVSPTQSTTSYLPNHISAIYTKSWLHIIYETRHHVSFGGRTPAQTPSTTVP